MIEVLDDFPAGVLAFACHGHVTRRDYESVLIPRVNQALQEHEKLRLYYEIDADFEGIDPGAVWEDTLVGLKHLTRWERVAVVTDVDWIRRAMSFFGFLMPGEFKVYPTAGAADAREWIAA